MDSNRDQPLLKDNYPQLPENVTPVQKTNQGYSQGAQNYNHNNNDNYNQNNGQNYQNGNNYGQQGPYPNQNQDQNQHQNQNQYQNQNQHQNQVPYQIQGTYPPQQGNQYQQGYPQNNQQGYKPGHNQGMPPPPPPQQGQQIFLNLPPMITTGHPRYPLIMEQCNLPCQICTFKGGDIVTMTPGCATYSWSVCLFILTGCFCFWIPFVMNQCKDIKIRCSRCGHTKAIIQRPCC